MQLEAVTGENKAKFNIHSARTISGSGNIAKRSQERKKAQNMFGSSSYREQCQVRCQCNMEALVAASKSGSREESVDG